MPASYVHQCIAADACRALQLHMQPALRHAVRAGAEGPDPLFFSLLRPAAALPAARMGRMIHTRHTDTFLLALMDACRADALLEAFCCGFLAHYAADTVCHPFIYAHSLTRSGAYSTSAHTRLEHRLDLLLYRRRGHAKGAPLRMAGYARLSSGAADSIAAAMSRAARSAYHTAAPNERAIRRCFDDAVTVSRLMDKGTAYARLIPRGRADTDAANERHMPWRSVWTPDIVRTESFFQLMDEAAGRAVSLMRAAHGYWGGSVSHGAMRAQLGAQSYCSGLPWQLSCPARTAPGVVHARRESR